MSFVERVNQGESLASWLNWLTEPPAVRWSVIMGDLSASCKRYTGPFQRPSERVQEAVLCTACIMLMWCRPHNRYPIAHLWGHDIECQKSWGPFHKCFWYSKSMENTFCHNSILSHEIATKFCSHNNNNNTTVIKNSMPTSSALFFRKFKPHPWKNKSYIALSFV